MPFDIFVYFSLLDLSLDPFASQYPFTENALMRAEAEKVRTEKRLEREIQQKVERHERDRLFFEWYVCKLKNLVCKLKNLNGSTDDFERQLSKAQLNKFLERQLSKAQFNKFLDEIDGKLFEMECPGCGLVIMAPTKKGVLRCPHCDRLFHIDARIALADASEDRPEDTAS